MKKLFITALSLISLGLYAETKPNVLIIFTDDQGYQDLGIFGAEGIKTPNIDKLASEELVGRSFYVSTSVCTPSRAALQTGKYHYNVKLFSNGQKQKVYFPDTPAGMPQSEVTIAEMLKPLGYHTALIGKWHLGHQDEYLPIEQGYDYFYGIPYSNDMWLPENMKYAKDIVLRKGFTMETMSKRATNKRPSLENGKEDPPLMRGNEVVEYPADQATLTERYVDETIKFIENAKGEPFFVCLTPAMPHDPQFVTDKFKGVSSRGTYGDCIAEIDANVGRLVAYLKEKNLFDNTIIFYTSDNGPYLKANKYGKALPLKGGKFGLNEGGLRVPFLVTYPKLIKANTDTFEIMSSIDIMPTIAELTGAKTPEGIDGVSLLSFLSGKTKTSPRDEFTYAGSNVAAITGFRKGDWKLVKNGNANAKNSQGYVLYNLKDDIGEKTDLAKKHPEKVQELKALLDERNAKFKKQ